MLNKSLVSDVEIYSTTITGMPGSRSSWEEVTFMDIYPVRIYILFGLQNISRSGFTVLIIDMGRLKCARDKKQDINLTQPKQLEILAGFVPVMKMSFI